MDDPVATARNEAVSTIRAWHGEEAWDIYCKHSPEMKRLFAALDAAESRLAQVPPREPTTEMMLAGMDVQDRENGQDTAGVWKAMYDAAIRERAAAKEEEK